MNQQLPFTSNDNRKGNTSSCLGEENEVLFFIQTASGRRQADKASDVSHKVGASGQSSFRSCCLRTERWLIETAPGKEYQESLYQVVGIGGVSSHQQKYSPTWSKAMPQSCSPTSLVDAEIPSAQLPSLVPMDLCACGWEFVQWQCRRHGDIADE